MLPKLFQTKTDFFVKNKRIDSINQEAKIAAPHKKLGTLLVDLGILDVMEVKRLLYEQRLNSISKTPIGTLAIEYNFATEEQIILALTTQKKIKILSTKDLASIKLKLPTSFDVQGLKENEVRILAIEGRKLSYAYDMRFEDSSSTYMDIKYPEYNLIKYPAFDGSVERSYLGC